MPFTPFHMGPGLLVKALLQGSFSLMVFGWAQVVMDIQPLIVLLSGEGHLHGFTHTFLGASLLGVASALSGKYLAEFGLKLLIRDANKTIKISWPIAFISAFMGSYSHVVLDAIMHSDMEPFYPLSSYNPLLQWISTEALHKVCLYSGLLGAAFYYLIQWLLETNKKR